MIKILPTVATIQASTSHDRTIYSTFRSLQQQCVFVLNIRTNINTRANPTRYNLEDIMCLVAQFTHNCQHRSANIYLTQPMVRILVSKNYIYFWAVNVFAIDQTVQNKNFTQVLIVCCVDFRVTSHSKHFQLASNTQPQLSSAAHGLSKFCVLDQAIMTSNPNDLNINISQTNSKTDIGIFKSHIREKWIFIC